MLPFFVSDAPCRCSQQHPRKPTGAAAASAHPALPRRLPNAVPTAYTWPASTPTHLPINAGLDAGAQLCLSLPAPLEPPSLIPCAHLAPHAGRDCIVQPLCATSVRTLSHPLSADTRTMPGATVLAPPGACRQQGVALLGSRAAMAHSAPLMGARTSSTASCRRRRVACQVRGPF